MGKYYYQCESLTCGHIHEKIYKSGPDRCEKCNYSNVAFLASWSLKDKPKSNNVSHK